MNQIVSVSSSSDRGWDSLWAWNPATSFFLFCLAHMAIWTLLPALMYHNPPKDTLEGITWGNMWLLGYDKHPFLAPWLSAWVSDLFGVVGWPIYLLDQLSVGLCFWAVWRVARSILEPRQALIAVAMLEGIHYYHFSSIPFNPNVAMLPTWALTCLTFYRALLDQSLRGWLLVGLCAGIAAMAKYEAAILFLVLFGLTVSTEEGRRSFRTPAFYLGILLAVAVVSPHFYWLAQHGFTPFHYALGNMELEQGGHSPTGKHSGYTPLLFLLDQARTLLPMFLLYLPFFKWKNRGWTIAGFDRHFLQWLAFGPLTATLLIAVFSGANLISRWAFPFFSFAGVALVAYFRPEITTLRLKIFFAVILSLTLSIGGGMYWMIFVRPHYTGVAPYSITYPSPEMAERITREWRERYGRPLKYVAGDRWVISGICAFSPDKPIPYFNWKPRENPWLEESALRREGAVMVHEIPPGNPPQPVYADMRHRFPDLVETTLIFPHHTQAKVPPVQLWVAFVPPQDVIRQPEIQPPP
ncbi:MAG: glycosyltransferase family 39 protein [Methylococcaceae bacterium]|nr:glycosyltransferase family 39 protein [Methylococcaceae bacterium]